MSLARQAADVFQEHRDELGFVNRAQCEEGDLYTAERDDKVVGSALVNHCVRKPQTTLYDIAVLPEYRREGIGVELVNQIARESPHGKIVAKCPVDLPSNDFYNATGWECVGTENGKNRDLNVWEYQIKSVDIITTGRPDLTQYAHKHGWLSGTRLDALGEYENAGISPEFIDVHWEDPDRDTLLAKAMQYQPKYVVAGEVERVPEWAVVGYSTPTSYAGTNAPVWEYYGRDVHILGGTMNNIKLLIDHLRNDIVSIDTNTMHSDAIRFGEYWSKCKPNRKKHASTNPAIRRTYENSILNMTYAFEEWGLITPS